MRELKSAGKIRHIGLSTHNPLVGIEAVKSAELYRLCEERGAALFGC